MDIFDLNIVEFEKEIDKLLVDITSDNLLEELIENGLIIEQYEKKSPYKETHYENTWIHTKRTSSIKNNMEVAA